MERDKYLTPQEAIDLGLGDVIIQSDKLKKLRGE
jgi:ATP-dependent protease ClpP protease subunit